MAVRLTDALIKKLAPAAAGQQYLQFDSEVPGFAVRVTAGAKALVLDYRFAGKQRRITIGRFGDWSVSAARTEAQRLRRDIDLGIDPLAERQKAEPPADDDLFRSRAETFLELGRRKRGLPLRPATKKEYRRALLTYAAELHGKLLAGISRGEIARVIQRVARERGEVSAMRCRAALSRLYSWAIANGHADGNPVTGTEGYETPKRERVLSDAELRAIWAATAEPSDFHLIIRLLLWTGTRRGEPGGMADSELDGALWTIPGARTKNGRVLVLPLPRQAQVALAAWQLHKRRQREQQQRQEEQQRPQQSRVERRDLLFGRGRKGFQGWSDAKERLNDRIARANAEQRLGRPLKESEAPAPQDVFPEWDLHDVRRTVETRMAGLGIPKDYVNRVLNHAAGPITEAYDLHSYVPQKAHALQRWADELDRIVGSPGSAAKVIELSHDGAEVVPISRRSSRAG